MIIADLNHLETVSEAQNIEGGFKINIASPVTQVNVGLVTQLATSTALGLLSASSGASNFTNLFQGNFA